MLFTKKEKTKKIKGGRGRKNGHKGVKIQNSDGAGKKRGKDTKGKMGKRGEEKRKRKRLKKNVHEPLQKWQLG